MNKHEPDYRQIARAARFALLTWLWLALHPSLAADELPLRDAVVDSIGITEPTPEKDSPDKYTGVPRPLEGGQFGIGYEKRFGESTTPTRTRPSQEERRPWAFWRSRSQEQTPRLERPIRPARPERIERPPLLDRPERLPRPEIIRPPRP